LSCFRQLNVLINDGGDIEFSSPNKFPDFKLLGRARQLHAFHFNVILANPLSALGTNEELDLAARRGRLGFDLDSSEVIIMAEFNRERLELTWSVQGEFGGGSPIEGMTHDFWNCPVKVGQGLPGPLGQVPRKITHVKVNPRLPGASALRLLSTAHAE
jgi:hypothetical protein